MKYNVFQEILKPLTPDLVKKCVNIFNSDYDYETFKTYEHLKTMIYVHLNQVSSLRTLEVAINNQTLGLSTIVRRSTFSDANKKRKADCFFWILEQLLRVLPKKKKNEFSKIVRILDSSPIQLKGNGYEWTKLTATSRCEGIKLHIEYDLEVKTPVKMQLSSANFNDSSMGKIWPIEEGIIYVFDKGYCDYNWWYSIQQKNAFFVTRLKNKSAIKTKEAFKISDNSPILEDNLVVFSNKQPRGGKRNLYTIPARKISVKRDGKTPLILITNLVNESAEKIAKLYKSRWAIELFFKWIKQRLKIKKFLGRSENAVKIQLITAIIAYILVFLFKYKHKILKPLYLVLMWVKCNLTVKIIYKSSCLYTKYIAINSMINDS